MLVLEKVKNIYIYMRILQYNIITHQTKYIYNHMNMNIPSTLYILHRIHGRMHLNVSLEHRSRCDRNEMRPEMFRFTGSDRFARAIFNAENKN